MRGWCLHRTRRQGLLDPSTQLPVRAAEGQAFGMHAWPRRKKAAREIKQIDTEAAQWIASTALRELESEAVEKRLRERQKHAA